MSFRNSRSSGRGLVRWAAALVVALTITAPANAVFHLWNLQEVYTNSSGTLQFIELFTGSSSQQFVGGQQISVSNVGATMTNMFTIPSNLPSDSFNRTFILGTAGLQAAGGPPPDFFIPNNFLFAAGGTINFFGLNSGPYSALPTDGILSRTWTGGNAINSPTNFAGVTGSVPEPTTMTLTSIAAAGMYWLNRRRRNAGLKPATP